MYLAQSLQSNMFLFLLYLFVFCFVTLIKCNPTNATQETERFIIIFLISHQLINLGLEY
jgi:hypothetical protein